MFILQQEPGNASDSNIQVIFLFRILPILIVAFFLIKYVHLIMLSYRCKFKQMQGIPYPRFWSQTASLILLYFSFFYAFNRSIIVYGLFGIYGLITGLWMYIFYKEGYVTKIFNNINYKRRCLLFLRALSNIFLGGYFLFGIFLVVIFAQAQSPEIYTFEAREIYYHCFLIIYCIFNICVDFFFIGFLVTSERDYNQSLTVGINRDRSH